jgi:membrane protein
MIVGKMDFLDGYLGRDWAEFYFKLWNDKFHIARRVTTIRILDRARLSYSNTFDIDWSKIIYPRRNAEFLRQSLVLPEKYLQDSGDKKEQVQSGLYIPLVPLKRQHFLDVDCFDFEGKVVHLARKKVNDSISAHILVGSALNLSAGKISFAQQEELYSQILSYISSSNTILAREASANINLHEKRSALSQIFLNHLSSFGVVTDVVPETLTSLTNEMQESYIQAILALQPPTDISIIKMRFTINSDIFRLPKRKIRKQPGEDGKSVHPGSELNVRQIASIKVSNLHETSVPSVAAIPQDPSDAANKQHKDIPSQGHEISQISSQQKFATILDRLPRNLGQRACRLYIKLATSFEGLFQKLGIRARHLYIWEPMIGVGYTLSHTRVIAPDGLFLEDVTIEGQKKSGMETIQSDLLKIRMHHERCAIMDDGLGPGAYCVNIKINPKRSSLIWPVAGISFTLLALTLLALLLGPERLVRHDAALAGGLFIFPSLALIFLSRENEHEVVGKTTLPLQVLAALSALSGGVSGALIASLPSTIQQNMNNRHIFITFWALLGSLLLAFAAFFLSSFQFCRIGIMRSIVEKSREEPNYADQQRVLSIKYSWFYLSTVIAILLFVIILVRGCHTLWPQVASIWLVKIE